MNTGIGTSSGEDAGVLAAEPLDGLFDHLLHAKAVILALPADEGAAVVFEGKAIAGHGATM